MSSRDVRTEVVKFDFRVSSRKRETANDQRLNIRSRQGAKDTCTEGEVSSDDSQRKLSLMMTIRALTDGHCRAIRAVLLAMLL